MPDCDVLIIGSGPAGAHAAQALVESGVTVLMLDGGNDAPKALAETPDRNFADIRKNDTHQYRWFLGDDLSGIPIEGLTGGLGGGQVSGNRSYVVRGADHALPLALKNCQVIQSLAKGGLGAAWGAACAILDEGELFTLGLDAAEMQTHYDAVIERIGVSGAPVRPGIQPALKPDHHAARAFAAFERNRKKFETDLLSVQQPLSAVLTKDLGDRRATAYSDMDYWADPRKSVYRPQFTIEELERRPNFHYKGGFIVDRIEETTEEAVVYAHGRGPVAGLETFSAKRVILAAGAVNSARILLRSKRLYDTPQPFVGKPHVFSACIDWKSLGSAGPDERTSLCQLLVMDERRRGGMQSGCAQLYSYRSLQLFRLIGSAPAALPEAMRVLAALTPSLVIADIRFPTFAVPHNTLKLKRSGTVSISMDVRGTERDERDRTWKRLRKALAQLGMPAVKNMTLPEASTSHYAGTIPQSADGRIPLTTDAAGKVRQCQRIWVADASVLPCLPAKPHTLTIMANARRIALETRKSLG